MIIDSFFYRAVYFLDDRPSVTLAHCIKIAPVSSPKLPLYDEII